MKADIVEVVTAITTTAPNNDEMLQVHLSTGSGFSVPSIWKSTTSSCSRRNSSSTFATDVNMMDVPILSASLDEGKKCAGWLHCLTA